MKDYKPIDFEEYLRIRDFIQRRKSVRHYGDVSSSHKFMDRFWLLGPNNTAWLYPYEYVAIEEIWDTNMARIESVFAKRPGSSHTPRTIKKLLKGLSLYLLEPINVSYVMRYTSLGFRHLRWCIDALTELEILYQIPALSAPLSPMRSHQAPKLVFRQTGMLHYVLGIKSSTALFDHPIVGKSWVNMILASYLTFCDPAVRYSYHKSYNGAYLDLILDLPSGERWVINLDFCLGFLRFRKHYHRTMQQFEPNRMFYVFPSINPAIVTKTHSEALFRGVEVLTYREMGRLIQLMHRV
jgi:predicted AAA+ superfamily ATPase